MNLGRMYCQVADDDHAIGVLKQAIRCIEPYAESGELHAIGVLSGTLDLLSRSLYRKRKKGEALKLAMRAAELGKRAAEADPEAYEGEHVFRLVNIASLRTSMGNPRGALAAIKQAETIARRLVDRDPGRYEDRLANVLLNKGAILTSIDRFSDAIACATEGLELYRAINSATQDGFVLELVTVSINCVKAAILLGDPDTILDACEKVVLILPKEILTDVKTKEWIFAAAARAMATKYGNAEGLIELERFLNKHPDLASEIPLTPETFSQAIAAGLRMLSDKDTNQRNERTIKPVDIASLLGRALADAQSRARPPA
jgi:tetratricopeptide (TPR) repeat protein